MIKSWKKHTFYRIIVFILSFILVFYPLLNVSKDLFFIVLFFITSSLVLIVFIFRTIFYKFRYGEYFRFIERLNDRGYIEDAPLSNNILLIVLIFVYLLFFYLIFDSYLQTFNYDFLGVLLLSWLATLIVRSAHYSNIEASKKISEVVTSFIFPIGIVIMAVYLNNFFRKSPISKIENNVFIIPYFIAIVSLSFLLEISLGVKKKTIINSHIKISDDKKSISQPTTIVEYTEILYSKESEPKNKKSFYQSNKRSQQRTRWENVDTIEKNINNLHKYVKKSDIDEKVESLSIKKRSYANSKKR